MQWEHDDLCGGCQVVTARLSNRGKSPLDAGVKDIEPGESIICDVVTDVNKRGLTTSSHRTCCLIVTDVKSCFTVPVGLVRSASSKRVAEALLVWSRDCGLDQT
jgi:hypothetical protein